MGVEMCRYSESRERIDKQGGLHWTDLIWIGTELQWTGGDRIVDGRAQGEREDQSQSSGGFFARHTRGSQGQRGQLGQRGPLEVKRLWVGQGASSHRAMARMGRV